MGGNHENQHLEYKERWNDNAKKTAIAFANTDGGTILVGVDDDGNTIGVDDPDQCQLSITSSLREGIVPDLTRFIWPRVDSRDGKTILAVDISRGTNQPYCLKDKGPKPAGVFIRVGNETVQASYQDIYGMLKDSSPVRFEMLPSMDQNLTFEASSRVWKNSTGRELEPRSFELLGMTDRDGNYTNLAWLLSDQCDMSIKTGVFQNDNMRVSLDRDEFTGPLLTQFEDLWRYLSKYNATGSVIRDGLHREDQRAYNPVVMREALLNMIIHRDYSNSLSISTVSIFDDHITFMNPGGLVKGVDLDDFLNGMSTQRNRNLAHIFFRLHLVEAYGTGIARILMEYPDEGKNLFSITGGSFRLSLPSKLPFDRDSWSNGMTEPKPTAGRGHAESTEQTGNGIRHILDRLPETFGRKQMQEMLEVSQTSAARIVKTMLDEGLISREGVGKNTRYRKLPPQER